MFLELKGLDGELYAIRADSIKAVIFIGGIITVYLSGGKPFLAVGDNDTDRFMDWYNSQEKIICHPVDDTKPLEVEKPKATKGRKKND